MDRVLSKKVLLLDGGLGTTLEDEHGVRFSASTPLWSSHLLVENTATLARVQADFAAAGADVLLTATYQASFDGFEKTTTADHNGVRRDDAQRYMRSAVQIARDAFKSQTALVALSLGAYGATMVPSTEYSGEYGAMDERGLRQFHQERLHVFRSSPEWDAIDLIAFETLPRLDEVRAVTQIMQSVGDKPFWVSCVFPHEDENLPDGSSVGDVLAVLLKSVQRPFAIGINCTKLHKIRGLLQRFEAEAATRSLELPWLVVYPDGASGQVYDTMSQRWIGVDGDDQPWDEQMAAIVREIQARARWKGILVGGCCKTRPVHIRKLRQRLDRWVSVKG